MDVEADVNRGSRKVVQVAKDELLGHIFSQGELSESNLHLFFQTSNIPAAPKKQILK